VSILRFGDDLDFPADIRVQADFLIIIIQMISITINIITIYYIKVNKIKFR
jgi:hypothetical protein